MERTNVDAVHELRSPERKKTDVSLRVPHDKGEREGGGVTYVPELVDAVLVLPSLSASDLLLAVLEVSLCRCALGSLLALLSDSRSGLEVRGSFGWCSRVGRFERGG